MPAATVKVKDMILNEGQPKICVPLVGRTKEEILNELKDTENTDFDLFEFRVDFFENVEELDRVGDVLTAIRNVCSKPLLFTFRTKKEGGETVMSEENYFDLNKYAIQSGNVDMVDLELFSKEEGIRDVVGLAHQNGIKVVMSNHDFDHTPNKEVITSRLVRMQELGADITKIAVMPESEEDVFTLLLATLEMKKKYGDRPCITMSMGQMGIVSRLTGELTGSCLTFGAAKKASAPGQIGVEDLRGILDILSFG